MSRLSNFKTSNPAFTSFFWDNDSSSTKKMSVLGILIKSLICIAAIATITVYIWHLYEQGIKVRWFTLGGMLGSIIISIVISIRQHWASYLVPLY